ncbi:glutamate receptor ionotropic, delta-2-like [Panulirus ornatus]|uniref:glutamate receptor ionotropic, delta-2-like n=1 Tax=Panulirus ornatus TaxID=150431 RepID=UPI003A85FC7D
MLLREGTQVALVQLLSNQKAQLLSSRISPDGQVSFHQVGLWSVNGVRRTSKHQVQGRLIPELQQLYTDFQGRQLVVATKDNWPFFKVKTLKNGTVIPVSGIDFNVLNTLSENLNFTYQLVLPLDGKWGGPQPDNTITGLIGMVARHEAHTAICELTITDIRETVVDFTVPYYMESTTLVSPAPKEKNRSFAILSPFTAEVWMCICLMTALVGPLLYIVTRFLVLYLEEKDSVYYTLEIFTFNMYRSMMIQGNLIISHHWSIRFVFICWYLFSLYVYALYSGTLTASLAIRTFEKPIDSLYDLAQAHQDGYTIGTIRDTNFDATFKNAKGGIYKEVWQLFNHKDRDRSFVPSQDMGIDMVLKHKFVLINAQLNSRMMATQRGREKFYFARETFLSQGYGIACSSGSPFKDIFSRMSVLSEISEVLVFCQLRRSNPSLVTKPKRIQASGTENMRRATMMVQYLNQED